jgi:hypothetical protein
MITVSNRKRERQVLRPEDQGPRWGGVTERVLHVLFLALSLGILFLDRAPFTLAYPASATDTGIPEATTVALFSHLQLHVLTRSSLCMLYANTARLPLHAQPQFAFPFLPVNALGAKLGRNKGITEIRGPFYFPVTRTYLDELFSDWGEYVDGIKFASGSFSLRPEKRLS